MSTALIVLLVPLLVFDVVITQGLLRDDGLTGSQKAIQILLTWLLPLLGGLIVLSMLGGNHSRRELRDIMPFPFYLAGQPADVGGSSHRQFPHDGDDGPGSDIGEGTCGSE